MRYTAILTVRSKTVVAHFTIAKTGGEAGC